MDQSNTAMADVEPVHTNTVNENDVAELAHFGYKQELRRDWGLLHNFGISFSIIVSLISLVLLAGYQ